MNIAALLSWAPALLTMLLGVVILRALHWLLLKRNTDISHEARLPRQLLLFGLGLLFGIAVILSLPLSEEIRKQILALFGVLISGVVAFSSTTMTANLMAGLMMRVTRPFRIGDFIEVGPHFGRVFQRGLFDTDIQTEQRQIIALPNMYLVQNPITVTHSSGTVISAEVSLGYEVHHERIEKALREAAEDAGLRDAFVQVLRLEDHAVVYRISGVLENVKSLLSTRSNLYRSVLDRLHDDDIEITSPRFMVQRPESTPVPRIPVHVRKPAEQKDDAADLESVVFDKAEEAASLEDRRKRLKILIDKAEVARKESEDEDQRKRLTLRVEQLREALEEVTQSQKDADKD